MSPIKTKAPKSTGHTAAALKYFLAAPGQHITVEDLAQDLGGITHGQVGAAVNYIIKSNKLPGLVAVQNGQVWLYTPQEAGNEEYWLVVRHTANGAQTVLEDGNGDLWVAKPVGI